MKMNIASAILFFLFGSYFYHYKSNHLDDLYLSYNKKNIIEEIKNTNDIDKLRNLSLMIIKLDDHHVESYNNMLNKAFNVFIVLSLLSTLFSLLAIIPDKKKPKKINCN